MFQTERLMTVPGRTFRMLVLVTVCSAVLIQTGQTQSLLCEHAGAKQMECKGCH